MANQTTTNPYVLDTAATISTRMKIQCIQWIDDAADIADEDVIAGGDDDDLIDGGTEEDLIFGDNVRLDRWASEVYADFTSLRFQTLIGDSIYGEEPGINDGEPLNDGTPRLDPNGSPVWGNWDIIIGKDTSYNFFDIFGDDYIAGGAHDDTIFAQLGDDTVQGDGSIDSAVANWDNRVDAYRDDNGELQVVASFESSTDGDDYIEGNGGDDLIFGNLGQDDIIGGSSSLFSLIIPDLRPDGSDLIFGGAGTDISRNYEGDATVADGSDENIPVGTIITNPTGHARDADMILGDNGNIYRLVENVGEPAEPDPLVDATQYLEFNYDQTTEYEDRGDLRLIPRAAELLDYTPGGPDYNATSAALDIGAKDEVRGESGDDFIYGMVGNDVLFGDGQDDDLIGGYGHDWISGGTGQDGILGDDGRIYTSRNTGDTNLNGEPLNNIAPLRSSNQDNAKAAEGDVLDEYIKTPGNIQNAVINKSGALKKTVNITPFSFDPDWSGMDDEFPDTEGDTPWADDIIFGGLGSDFLHGGSGDDAISGSEALDHAYVPL